MQVDLVSLTVGGCILAFGLILIWSNWTVWVRHKLEFANDSHELRHSHFQFRRRVQTSGLIALLGVLIPVADLAFIWQQGIVLVSLLWIAICCVCLWIVLLALGDLATTRAHSRATLARLEAHKRELMEQLEEIHPAPSESTVPSDSEAESK